MTSLKIREKILKNNSSHSVLVPDLSSQNMILDSISINSVDNVWDFEVSIKINGFDQMKLSSSYFAFNKMIKLDGLRSKIEESSLIELNIKPKRAPKDFHLDFEYQYDHSIGSIIYQNCIKHSDLVGDSTILQGIVHNSRPTLIKVSCPDFPIKSVSFVPNFETKLDLSICQPITFDNQSSNAMSIDLIDVDIGVDAIKMWKYYKMEIELDGELDENKDYPIHILSYGFKW